ncbi:hypothetical protein COT50_02015 [candidate division WWE3 bacterium CG08_land_8_20_14_0_20_41_10]|uniref:Uncharacterized protein n=1 Tax=candidate division WWE3 bacterium CG08_land_8_20_14_0_20_41_10 TaxID=1975085 RepID=A0A2H0XC08_UNCKA|nr:MAG: hypothetical protein COT50_02015 [candidate division WWE3 bacterium CG08_land_8_20_14_0_20_41_10]
MADEKQVKVEATRDFGAFYDDLFSDPRAVDGKQVVTGILQGAPAQEAIKEPKSPEEVIALVTEAYTAVSPEQFVEFAQQQIEATLLTQSRIVEGVMGDSIDRCGLDATESSGTPDRAEGTKSSLNYREQIDGFEIPAKEALERFESRLLAEAECVGIAGSRLRTVGDMEWRSAKLVLQMY